MYVKQSHSTFFRKYDDLGYIVNKQNGTDRVLNKTGAVFVNALSRKPRLYSEIFSEVKNNFHNVDEQILNNDLMNFYKMLEEDELIIIAKTEDEANSKDSKFSYNKLKPIGYDFTPTPFRAEESSQQFLTNHFKSINNHTPLINFQIELTSKCNERCIHCYIPHKYKDTEISDSLFESVINQCVEMNVLNLTLSGGEPMMHRNFKSYLKKVKEHDFYVDILSNLTLLDDEIIEILKDMNQSSLQVSLYSMDSKIHDEITQLPGAFNKTMNSIEKLIANDIPLQISCPTMKQNKNCYKDVIKWAHSNKIGAQTDFIMMARYDHSTDNLQHRLNTEEVTSVIKDVMSFDKTYLKRILTEIEHNETKRDFTNDPICGVCISICGMTSNGIVYPCPGWQDFALGDLNNESLFDIWVNSERTQYLRNLRMKDLPSCVDCNDRSYCNLCLVRNANESSTGNPLEINKHFCEVASINHNLVKQRLGI